MAVLDTEDQFSVGMLVCCFPVHSILSAISWSCLLGMMGESCTNTPYDVRSSATDTLGEGPRPSCSVPLLIL